MMRGSVRLSCKASRYVDWVVIALPRSSSCVQGGGVQNARACVRVCVCVCVCVCVAKPQ